VDDGTEAVRVVTPLDVVRRRSDPAFWCCLAGFALGFLAGVSCVGVWLWTR
jgi:hypothetical protein